MGEIMRRIAGTVLLTCLFSLGLNGQSTLTVDKFKFADAASARYYSLINQGLVSFSCDVKVNWDTVPKVLLVPAEIAGREGLQATTLRVSQGIRTTAKVEHKYPQGTPVLAAAVYDPFFSWLSDVVRGFMMTWSAKGLGGPIPGEDNIDSVKVLPSGYRVVLVNPRIQLLATKDYLVTEILTSGAGEEIDEHPTFTPSPQGMLFTGDQANDKQGEKVTQIRYEIDYQLVEALNVPHNVHLLVNDNMDMKFSFERCLAERGKVIKVRASPAH
jgi:hypothetical protein